MTVTLKKLGGSLAVIIPKAMAQGMVAGDRVELSERAEGILLERRARRPRRPIEDIVKNIDPAAYAKRNQEFANDRPVGREVW